MTLNQVIQRLEQLALSHKQINHFYFGNITEWLANGEVNYPACFVELSSTTISRTARQTQYKFAIWFADIENINADARANVVEVQSDLTSIAEDMAAMINASEFQDDWTIDDPVYPVTYYEEEFTDYVVAVSIDAIIGVDFLSDRCRVPTSFVFVDETNKDMIVNNYTYKGKGTEGTNLTVSSLSWKTVLLMLKGDKVLTSVTDPDAPLAPEEYRYNASAGGFEFGNDIEEEQILQILNRNIG